MKKIVLFLTVLCLMSSCSETIVLDESISLKSLESVPLSKRSAKEAIAIALQARTDFGLTKSRRTDKVLSVVALPTLSSRTEYADTSLYVVNFEGDGFAIVSSNSKSIGLLAITEDGYIGSLDEIDNPGLKQFVHAAGKYIPEDSVTGYEEINVEIVDTLFFCPDHPKNCY